MGVRRARARPTDAAVSRRFPWVHAAAKAAKPGLPALAKDAAAAKALPAMAAAMRGKPAEWIPQWLEFWRIHYAWKWLSERK